MKIRRNRGPFTAHCEKYAMLKNRTKYLEKIVLLLAVILTIAGTGCTQTTEPLWDEEGNLISYTRSELTSGLYIKDGDTFYRPLRYGMAFSQVGDDLDTSRFAWMLEGVDQTIPEVGTSQDIILISGSYPTSDIKLQHFTDMGATVGCQFSNAGEGNILFANGVCQGTSMSRAWAAMISNIANVRIEELNESPFPTELIGTDTGLLSGLQQGGFYKIGYYEGTQFEQMTVKADTRYWVEDALFVLSDYEQTRDGYFILELSPELPAGLYCINGYGLFYYTAGNTGIYLDESESFDPEGLLPEDEAETEQAPIIDSVGGNNDINTPTTTPSGENVPGVASGNSQPSLMPEIPSADPTPGMMMPGLSANGNTGQEDGGMLMPAG